MVLAPSQTEITHQSAATTAASLHLYHEGSVVETPLASLLDVDDIAGVAVVAPERGLVEWFPHEEQDLASLARHAGRVDATGWKVAVIVPAVRMGEAHRSLRGSPVTLQPWWADAENVRFGGPEVP
jgi:hypothetical protein